MADETYGNNVYMEQGGDRMVVASGGSLDVEDGGEIDIESSGALKFAGTQITASAAELDRTKDAGMTTAVLDLLVPDNAMTKTLMDKLLQAGAVARGNLAQDALAVYGIPLTSIRAADLASLAAAETAGDFYLTLSSDVIQLLGELSNNETEVSIALFQFTLPPEYEADADVKIRIKHKLIGAGTDNSSTMDCEAFEDDGEGAVGSDLVTTAAAASSKASWTTTDFVVTDSGLAAGDILTIRITGTCIESASSNLQFQIGQVAMLLDVKG